MYDIEKEVEWRMGDAYHHPVEFDHRMEMIKEVDESPEYIIQMESNGGGHRNLTQRNRVTPFGNWLLQSGNQDHNTWEKAYGGFYNFYNSLSSTDETWDNDFMFHHKFEPGSWESRLSHVGDIHGNGYRSNRQIVLAHALKSFPKLKVMSRTDRTWCFNNLAVFANSRALNEHGVSDQVILHTDNDMFPLRGFNSLHDQNLTRWEHKKPQAVWRGQFTGTNTDAIPFNTAHCTMNKINRKNLVNIYTDSKFVDVDRAHIFAGPFLNPIQQSEYLCILNVEGNDTSSGNQWMFSSNSIVLMQQTHTSESPWHYHLKPWYHYVPFDINNIEERVQWCINNPEQAKSIVKNANNLHMLMTDYNREYKIMYRICQKLCENNNLL